MGWGLAGAFAAAIAYGAATVLQAVGARRTAHIDAPNARLAVQLVQSLPYASGLVLDAVGFLLSLAALRSQPLFVVQAIVASSLAVTALLAVLVLGARPAILEWIALLVVTGGLTLLALSATSQKSAGVDYEDRAWLLVAVVVAGAVTVVVARRTHGTRTSDAWLLGFLAGLMYAGGSISARVLATPHSVWSLLADPAFWAMVLSGVLGLLVYAMALQRGSVTLVTSAVVVTETLLPAALGITLLGDRPAHGLAGLAAIGFAASVVGSVALARYGEPPTSDPHERRGHGTRTTRLAADGG